MKSADLKASAWNFHSNSRAARRAELFRLWNSTAFASGEGPQKFGRTFECFRTFYKSTQQIETFQPRKPLKSCLNLARCSGWDFGRSALIARKMQMRTNKSNRSQTESNNFAKIKNESEVDASKQFENDGSTHLNRTGRIEKFSPKTSARCPNAQLCSKTPSSASSRIEASTRRADRSRDSRQR